MVDFEQIGIAVAFVLTFMLISAIAQPYRDQANDYFAVACNFMLTAVFFFSVVLKVSVLTEAVDDYLTEELRRRFAFDLVAVGAVLFICVAGALILATVMAVFAIYEAAHVPTIRLVQTGQKPPLPMELEHQYHMYLSHIWSNAQDQCAAIKRQLHLLLPGSQIFLDTDDMEDLNALEDYVHQSAVMLVFVSKGYFKSPNSLRELNAALEKDTALTLVHDPLKGGSGHELMESECPDELKLRVFEMREMIEWHRLHHFQLISLKMIAAQLLLGSPAFKTMDKISIYVPNELMRRKIVFKTPAGSWFKFAPLASMARPV